MDVVQRGALGADRTGLLSDLADWIEAALGHRPHDLAPYERALTHGSYTDAHGEPSYERLEFLGDRVLGLAMAAWLYELFPAESEGQLTKRFNALVAGAVCADVARTIGAAEHVRVSKQGRGDGIAARDNVLGDVTEALLGALYLDAGPAAAAAAVRRLWASRVRDTHVHPKSALQEWAAAHRRAVPAYTVVDRRGPDHAPTLTVEVAVGPDRAVAEGGSKQDAEIAAAAVLLRTLTAAALTPRRRGRRA